MSPGTIALIVVAVSIALWALFMANVTMRKQRRAAFASAGSGTSTTSGGAGGGASAPRRHSPRRRRPSPNRSPSLPPRKQSP